MQEDYLKYWGITKAPFSLTPDPEMLYLSTQHSECLMRLKYAIFSQKGGALLVSDNAGNGKTSVLGRLKNDLNDYYGGRVRVVFIDHPTLAPIEMISEISNQLGGEMHTTEKIRALNHLRDRLYTLYNENIKVVVIVDEGQMLKDRPDILGELRILLNFCVSDAFLLTFIFSGQKPLDSVLRDMPEFWQRLPVRFFLRNLDFNDTRGMIRYRLDQVGAPADLFTEDAYEGIYNYSEGCPRIACAVADLCLVIGYSKGARRIGFVEVSTACRDMDSSGDGFHYYAFIKSQNMPLDSGRPKPKSSQKPPPSYPARKPATQVEAPVTIHAPAGETVSAADSVICSSCGERNGKSRSFCTNCKTPLFRKCHGCGSKFDTISNDCPHCGINIEAAKADSIKLLKRKLEPYDIMENSHSTWLGTLGYSLEPGEEMLIAFPRGNMITPGPSLKEGSAKNRDKSRPCDFILTDRRLIFGLGDDSFGSDLKKIDTFTISNTGMIFTKKTILLIGFDGKIYRLALPYTPGKSRAIFDILSSYVRAEMLK